MITTAQIQANELDDSGKCVIETLLYFDLFSYPLRSDELMNLLHYTKLSAIEVNRILNKLVEDEFIYRLNDFFSLNPEDTLLKRRLKGNRKAEKMMKKAKWFSALIGSFPFVRCVCISGAISKGYSDEDGDIDYFIITEPSRLWIARTLLMAFKKIFLLNSRKYFCINYFIDTDHLEIEDKNIFTAIELFTLIPMNNQELFEKFVASNSWAKSFLPNYKKKLPAQTLHPILFIRKNMEKLFSGKFGEWLDTYFLHLTLKQWKKKFPHFSPMELDLTMRSRKYISKHHPQNMQKKILQKFEESKRSFETKFNVRLNNG